MSYTPPAGDALNFTWVGESAYTPPAGDEVNFGWESTITGQIAAPSPLGEPALVGESLGVHGSLSASRPLGDPAGLASVTGVVTGDLLVASPLGSLIGTGTPVIAGPLRTATVLGDPAGLGYFVVFGPLRTPAVLDDPAGFALHAPNIAAIRGQTVTLYRAVLSADGYESITIPISSFQARAKYGESSYLAVTVPAADQWVDAINARADGELSIEAGAQFDGQTFWAELLRVTLDRIRSDQGPRRWSITIDGYAINAYLPKQVTVGAGNYDRQEGAGRSYRLPDVDFNVRPGDQVTLADETTLIVGAISYTVSTQQASMEMQALTDSTLLAELPW